MLHRSKFRRNYNTRAVKSPPARRTARNAAIFELVRAFDPGSFPHPLRNVGVNTPNFRTTPPASGERREREEGEGGGKGRGKEKGRDPQGLIDTPHVPNPVLMISQTVQQLSCYLLTYRVDKPTDIHTHKRTRLKTIHLATLSLHEK